MVPREQDFLKRFWSRRRSLKSWFDSECWARRRKKRRDVEVPRWESDLLQRRLLQRRGEEVLE